ncbi:hypothetical protein GQ53DRAFT_863431 [Thozetella sp. PMI_491]|nr:hypothetical protein GQ53DRAFT_863431 [Thozetella sp. PMI_491]
MAPNQEELGFSTRQGVNWSKYLSYRPVYPNSFFQRIYDYHSRKAGASWSLAHDIGAGCGIVSAALATRFSTIIVSDPNDGYADIARRALVEESLFPEEQFRFLQEKAEDSSVESGTVDMAAPCECIHWMDVPVAIKEFHRQLKVGGTLAIGYYSYPKILGNEKAQEIWVKIWRLFTDAAPGPLFDNASRICNTGLDSVELSEDDWEAIERVYVNSHGSTDSFKLDDRTNPSKVGSGETLIWLEGDEDWHDFQGFSWLKGYMSTWISPITEDELRGLWNELESALGGEKAHIETPVVTVLATKK